jgi:hypothetical protein
LETATVPVEPQTPQPAAWTSDAAEFAALCLFCLETIPALALSWHTRGFRYNAGPHKGQQRRACRRCYTQQVKTAEVLT